MRITKIGRIDFVRGGMFAKFAIETPHWSIFFGTARGPIRVHHYAY